MARPTVARLENLLMETIDLFQHRIDAWATGLAYRRIAQAPCRSHRAGWRILRPARPIAPELRDRNH
jgi:hypothetical protein